MQAKSRRISVLAAVLGLVACSSSQDPSEFAPQNPNSDSKEHVGQLGTTTPPPTPVDFTKCATQTVVAQAKPVSLVFMVDQSGSMSINNSPKWDAAKAASKAFFEAPDSAGVSASVAYFPFFPAEDPNNYSCTVSDYATPQVFMTALPSGDFAANMEKQKPGGATPTYVALSGAISYGEGLMNSQGDSGAVAVVLVTDGLPDSECPGTGNSLEDVKGLASTAANAGLLTYVIGVGKQLTRLHELATSGGTNNAFIVDTQNLDQIQHDLLSSLNSIRFQLSCDYEIPAPPPGQEFDRDLVNVQYKVDGQTDTFLSSQTCADGTGWRYDNPADPKRILLCESSCKTVRAKAGEVDVLFGCATKYGGVK
jgi:Mg-chelatase subunit ChlD